MELSINMKGFTDDESLDHNKYTIEEYYDYPKASLILRIGKEKVYISDKGLEDLIDVLRMFEERLCSS